MTRSSGGETTHLVDSIGNSDAAGESTLKRKVVGMVAIGRLDNLLQQQRVL